MRVELRVTGNPAGKGSHTAGLRRNGTAFVRPSNPRALKSWEQAVAIEARRVATELGLHGALPHPYAIGIDVIYPPVKSTTYGYPAKGCDLDKLHRAINDGLVRGGLLLDDKHYRVAMPGLKRYAEDGEQPGCVIRIKAGKEARDPIPEGMLWLAAES